MRLNFSVEKESEIFSAELTIQREDFLEDFNVSLAPSILESLPWPPDYSVISSQPLRFLSCDALG